jgi:hypothetical protein
MMPPLIEGVKMTRQKLAIFATTPTHGERGRRPAADRRDSGVVA